MKFLYRYVLIAAFSAIFSAQFAVFANARILNSIVISDHRAADENLCALTFDDGPSRYTPQLLDGLATFGIPATFFVLGSNAQCYPNIVKRMLADGHEVENHSYGHPNLNLISIERKNDEIRRTDKILRELGATPRFLRPPYGAYDSYTVKIADELGLSLLFWSVDSKDWKRLPSDYALLRDGHGAPMPDNMHGIFLFHDIHKKTVDDLSRIVTQLRAGGCQRFVTVSEYLEGLIDVEPGLLMTRARYAPAIPQRIPLAVQHQILGLIPSHSPDIHLKTADSQF